MAALSLSELLQRRATATLLVASATLSALYLSDVNLEALLQTYPDWRREPWRLLSATLLHGSLLHLAFNLYWVALFGAAVERVYGAFRTAALFVLLGSASSAAELAVFDGGIGLSGIGYGLFGFLWVQRSDPRFGGRVDRRTCEVFVGWFLLCIVLTYAGWMRVANLAHAGGAIVGGLTGWVASAPRTSRLVRSVPLVSVALLLILACTLGRPHVKWRDSLAREYTHDGWEALNADQYERASAFLRQSLALDPDNAYAWWLLGSALWRMSPNSEAMSAFDRSSRQMKPGPSDIEFLVSAKIFLADQAREDGREQEEEALLREALLLEPNNARALSLLAYLLERSGDKKEAVELYERAEREGADEDWARERLSVLKQELPEK